MSLTLLLMSLKRRGTQRTCVPVRGPCLSSHVWGKSPDSPIVTPRTWPSSRVMVPATKICGGSLDSCRAEGLGSVRYGWLDAGAVLLVSVARVVVGTGAAGVSAADSFVVRASAVHTCGGWHRCWGSLSRGHTCSGGGLLKIKRHDRAWSHRPSLSCRSLSREVFREFITVCPSSSVFSSLVCILVPEVVRLRARVCC